MTSAMPATDVEAVALTTAAVLSLATVAFLALRVVLAAVAALLKWLRQAYVLRHTPMAPGALAKSHRPLPPPRPFCVFTFCLCPLEARGCTRPTSEHGDDGALFHTQPPRPCSRISTHSQTHSHIFEPKRSQHTQATCRSSGTP
jgi:hypothetical protein